MTVYFKNTNGAIMHANDQVNYPNRTISFLTNDAGKQLDEFTIEFQLEVFLEKSMKQQSLQLQSSSKQHVIE